MKFKKTVPTILLIILSVCLAVFALTGCKSNNAECVHSKVERHPVAAATCTADGVSVEYWYCRDCGKYFSDSAFTKEIDVAETIISATNHAQATHVAAAASDCVTDGNIEYWYCPDCLSYFKDGEYKEQTTAAEVVLHATNHKNAIHTAHTAATCTESGNIEYWFCPDCEKYFKDSAHVEEVAVTDLTIKPTAHAGAIGTAAVPATCNADGQIAYWYCPDCQSYFIDSACSTEILPEYTFLPATNHKKAKYIPATAATCSAEGNIQYWHCPDCETYFADGAFSTVITLEETVTEIDADNHDYEYVYDYDGMKYNGTCVHAAEHTVEQAAGTEAFPYLVQTEAQLRTAITYNGAYIKLNTDITLNSYVRISNNVTVDLNDKTVDLKTTGSTTYVFAIGDGDGNKFEVKILNGKIACDSAKGYGVYILKGSNATLIDCVIQSAFHAVRAMEDTTLTMEKTTVTTVGSNTEVYGVYSLGAVKMTEGSITAPYGVYSKVTFEMTDGAVHATEKTGIISYGTLKITGGSVYSPTLAINSKYSSYSYNQVQEAYYTRLEISGATVKSDSRGIQLQTAKATVTNTIIEVEEACVVTYRDAILVMSGCALTGYVGIQGNGTTSTEKSECGIDTDITLNDCNIYAAFGIYLPQSGKSEFTMTGGKIEATTTGIEIRAGKATLIGVAIISMYQGEFKAEANGNGSTVYGAAVAISQHTGDPAIDVTIKDCVLTGHYAFYEKDLMNDNSDNIQVTFEGDNTITGDVYSENCDAPAISLR